MRRRLTDRQILDRVLGNWWSLEPLAPRSVRDTGAFLLLLAGSLIAGLALLATVTAWSESKQQRNDCATAVLHAVGAQGSDSDQRGGVVVHGRHSAQAPVGSCGSTSSHSFPQKLNGGAV